MSTKGLLSHEYVNKNYHIEWRFQYTVNSDGADVQHLTKIDLDSYGDRDQIKIWCHSVRAFIQQKTNIVKVNMHLPQQVDRIIIFRFGEREPVCYAENLDGLKVYPGKTTLKIRHCITHLLKRLIFAVITEERSEH